MAYPNLKREMTERSVTSQAIADILHIHRNSVCNKINGNSHFSVEEAITIRNTLFPDLDIEKLFEFTGLGVSEAPRKTE